MKYPWSAVWPAEETWKNVSCGLYGASHSVFVAKPSNDKLPFRLWKARDRWYSHDGSRGLRKRKASQRSSVIVSQWNGDGASMHWLLRSVRSRVPACPWYAVPRTSRVSPISRWHAPLIVSLITTTSTRGLWLDSTRPTIDLLGLNLDESIRHSSELRVIRLTKRF